MATDDHPARFTDAILEAAYDMLAPPLNDVYRRPTLYDPFAGTGKGVDFMERHGFDAVGTELETEWAALSPNVMCADSLKFMRDRLDLADYYLKFDVVFTSPCYGNRMADHHEAKDACKACLGTGYKTANELVTTSGAVTCKKCKGTGLSRRNTYRHRLGRALSRGSAAEMQWGPEYRAFHTEAWRLVYESLKPGGLFLLNIKDHIRKGERQYVSMWHEGVIGVLGLELIAHTFVPTTGNLNGANAALRVDGEWLLLFRKPFRRPV